MHKEDNRGQRVLRGRKLEEAGWCGCSRQKKKGGEVAYPMERKAQWNSTQTKDPKGIAKREGE